MPNWGVVGTFVLSLILACGFLRRRCRGIGPPFGPRARFWASVIVVATAAVSAGFGLLIAAASHQIAAAYVGIIVPSALLLSRLPPQGDRLVTRLSSGGGPVFVGVLALPFSRLYDRMGDDREPLARYQAHGRVGAAAVDSGRRNVLLRPGATRAQGRPGPGGSGRQVKSITCSIEIVRLISLDTTPDRLRERLQMHPSIPVRDYPDDDRPRLARRLESDALNELHQFLAVVYRLGYHKLLIYPFRPSADRASRPARRA